MPPRRRAHSKSASISSDVNSPKSPASPTPKASTPAKRAPRKSTATSPPASPTFALTPAVAPRRKSRVPTLLQFPLVVASSFALNGLLFSLIAGFTPGDLASVSKHTESWAEIGGLLGWKVVELGVYWFGGFDALDVGSLSILLSTPHTILFALFFKIQPLTLFLTTVANLLSTTTPFALLTSLSPPHAPGSAPRSLVRNRPILTDSWTYISCSLLATAIFAVLLQFSFATFLPQFLIINFTGLKDLGAAHKGSSGLPTLLLALLPAGMSCTEFLFIPSTGVVNPHLQAGSFDPATASFGEHVYYNAWGWYSARQRELIKRTVTATVLVIAECVVQVYGTLAGAELVGAAGYAGLFGLGVALIGMAYEFVGGPSG